VASNVECLNFTSSDLDGDLSINLVASNLDMELPDACPTVTGSKIFHVAYCCSQPSVGAAFLGQKLLATRTGRAVKPSYGSKEWSYRFHGSNFCNPSRLDISISEVPFAGCFVPHGMGRVATC
jgi:hypothetical protein